MTKHPHRRSNRYPLHLIDSLERRVLLSGDAIFVTNTAADTVSEYDTSGATLNASLIAGLDAPQGIAVSGSDLFIANSGNGTVGEYTTSGATVNASLISGLTNPTAVAVSGAALFVVSSSGTGEYSTTGSTGNALLLAPFNGLAVSGSDLLVADASTNHIDGYDFSNLSPEGTPNFLFQDAINLFPQAVAVSGSDVYIGEALQGNEGAIGEYTASGATVNASLVPLSSQPTGVAVSGSDLFVLQQTLDSTDQNPVFSIGEYDDTSGAVLNASLIPGLISTGGIAIAGSTPTTTINQLAVVDQPFAASNGALSQVQVYIEDPTGALAATDDSDVTLKFNNNDNDPSIGASLSGTATVAAVNGKATFNNLSITRSGTDFTLTAIDDADVTSTSEPFNVTITSGDGGGGGGGSTSLVAVVSKTSLPASVVAGSSAHGTATVTVTNDGASRVSSTIKTEVFASLNGSDTLLGSVSKKLTINEGATAKVSVPIKSLPASLNGDYILLAATVDSSGDTEQAVSGPGEIISAPFVALSETVTSTLPPQLVSGTSAKGTATLTITNSGNVPSKGITPIDITASTVAGTLGTTITMLSKNLDILPGKPTRVTVPIKSIPALANGDYFIVAQVTDPFDSGTSAGSSATTTTVAAPFVTLAVTFASIPADVLKMGATLSITNSGNITDTGKFTATVGFSEDAGGNSIIGTNSETSPSPATLTLKPDKNGKLHVTGWGTLFKSVPTGVPYFLWVKITDVDGNTASAISTGEIG